jgi:hypothetical protein
MEFCETRNTNAHMSSEIPDTYRAGDFPPSTYAGQVAKHPAWNQQVSWLSPEVQVLSCEDEICTDSSYDDSFSINHSSGHTMVSSHMVPFDTEHYEMDQLRSAMSPIEINLQSTNAANPEADRSFKVLKLLSPISDVASEY